MYRYLLIFIIILNFKSLVLSQVIYTGGELKSDTYWMVDTVYLTHDLEIPNGITLVIKPGARILSSAGVRIKVNGCLKAIGKPDSMIVFTSLDTIGRSDTSSVNGGWGGIRIDSVKESNSETRIDYCIIENSKCLAHSLQDTVNGIGGGIFINESKKVIIINSVIRNNYARNFGGGIALKFNAYANIRNNLISNNLVYSGGGGISILRGSDPLIAQNIIINNIAYTNLKLDNGLRIEFGEGGGISKSSGPDEILAPLIINNLVSNNKALDGGGIYESSINSRLIGNIVVNNLGINDAVGGISQASGYSTGKYINNTIYNNIGSGIKYTSHPNWGKILLVNNIIQNNFYQNYQLNNLKNIKYNPFSYSEAYFVHNNTSSEILENNPFGYGNIDNPSIFERPSEGPGLEYKGYEADWRLKKESPDIDKGELDKIAGDIWETDIYGTNRVINGKIDIGAAEYNPNISIEHIVRTTDIIVYPNPFSGQLWIEIKSGIQENLEMKITDINGRVLLSRNIRQETTLVETGNWASGMYLITIAGSKGMIKYQTKVTRL